VTRKLLNVRDNLDRSCTRRRTANPAVIGDMEAAQSTLVGAHDKFTVVDKIEANPEVVWQGFPQNAVNGRHLQDHVTLAGQDGVELANGILVRARLFRR
jgi:hypothetical protein